MERLIVIMGVSGSGKSRIGRELAKTLSIPFLEGDDFHPKSNIEKMAGGTPLTNQDRKAWIDAMTKAVSENSAEQIVLSCSALNPFVRERLSAGCGRSIHWIYLDVSREELLRRLNRRKKHFMKANMLDSQLKAMEPPKDAFNVDGHLSPKQMVREIEAYLNTLNN